MNKFRFHLVEIKGSEIVHRFLAHHLALASVHHHALVLGTCNALERRLPTLTEAISGWTSSFHRRIESIDS